MILYAAYNTRTIYLIPAIILVCAMLFPMLWHREYSIFLRTVIGLAIGIIIIAWPQMFLNKNYFGTISPAVQTAIGSQDNLFIAQLEWGIRYPRYETFIGDQTVFSQPSVYFESKAGEVAYTGEHIASILDYIKWFFCHFLQACGIYWEHFISGITLFYTQLYLTNIKVNTIAFLLNCGIYMVALIGLIEKGLAFKMGEWKRLVPCFLMLIPVILILPGAVETRFFLPLYLLIYVFVAMKMNYREAWHYCKVHKISMCLILTSLFFTWCMAANNLLSDITIGTLTISGQYIAGG